MSPTQTRTRKSPTTEPTTESWAGTFDEWKLRAGPHRVTLGSGQRIEFRLMGLGELTLRGLLPDTLREIVSLDVLNKSAGGIAAVIADDIVRSVEGPEQQAELDRHLADLFELNKHVAAAGLVEPKVTPEQLGEAIDAGQVPFDDFEEIVRLITGQQTFDSRGVRVGVEPLDTFARFHHHHGLGSIEGCPGCAGIQDDLSSIHLDPV